MNDALHANDAASFAAAIRELRSWPLPAAFLLKSRLLGAVLDTTNLRGNGWEFIPDADDRLGPWQGCLWLRKSFHDDDDRDIIVHLATSEFVEPVPGECGMRVIKNDGIGRFGEECNQDRIGSMFSTDDSAYVFLRKIRFLADDNGLYPHDLGNEAPGEVLAKLEKEISANIRDYWLCSLEYSLDHWTCLADDLHFVTSGPHVEIPPGLLMPSEFVRQLEIANSMLCGFYRNQENGQFTAERLLVRLVRAIAEQGYAPNAEAELSEFPDGVVLANFLNFWFDDAPHDGATAHLLAYVLERACSELTVPCNAVSWKGISSCLADFGFRKEAVLAAERAVAAPDADDLGAEFLWKSILDFLHGIPDADIEDRGERLDLGWLIQILFSRENVLGGFEHFNTLLGLAMAENGNDSTSALGIIEKDFGRKRPVKETGEKPSVPQGPPNVRCPLAWQAYFAVGAELPVAIKRALSNFPKPLLSRHWGRFDIPERAIAGLDDAEFRYSVTDPPVMEDEVAGAIIDISWTQDATPVPPSGKWHYLSLLETAMGPDDIIIAHKLYFYREDDSEIVMLWAYGVNNPDDPDDNHGFQRFIPLAKLKRANAVVSVWEMLPYADGCLGEVRFRINGGKSLYAMMPYFCADRHLILRGEPAPSYIYALGILVEHAKEGEKYKTPDGDEIDLFKLRFFFNLSDEKTMCVCKFHGEVKDIRTVRVAANGDALCLDLDVGEVLPFPLPLYIKEEKISDGPVRVGDILEGLFCLQIDCLPLDDNDKAWRAAHPDGAGEEPPEETGLGYPVSIRKPNADGEVAKDGSLPSLDYVRIALARLKASYGCTAAVRLDPNPEGAHIAARVHGLALKYYVVAMGESVKESPRWDWDPDKLMPLFLRVSDLGTYYHIDYLNFPLTEKPVENGVDLKFERATPDPSSDIYELVTERTSIENMERVARKWHEGQLRKDGKTPYIEHPKAVAELMGKWGFEPESNGLAVAVAWGHDLIEETPPEKHEEVEGDIIGAVWGLLGEEERVLEAIRLLSRDKAEFPVKADYIRHVAETASQAVLAVKIADRICNTRDFLKLEGAGLEKARQYFSEGEPLFQHLGKTQYTSQRLYEGVERRIRAEIEAMRAVLDCGSGHI